MKTNWIWRSGCVAALSFAAGCSSPELADAPPPAEVAPPPPPVAAYVPPPPSSGRIETTELLGGPTPTMSDPPPPVAVTSMEPIKNPEDMTRAERAQVYGAQAPRQFSDRQAAGRQPSARRPSRAYYDAPPARPRVSASARPAPMATAPGPVSRAVPTVKPAAPKPAAPAVAAAKPAPAPKPVPPAAKPAPTVAAAKPAIPVPAPAAKAPAPTPPAALPAAKAPPATAAAPAKPKTKPEQLGVAVASDVIGASTLSLPPELSEGKTGVVSLTLAPTLADRITAEAARLGLAREARTADARATLSGDGYTIIPSASQSSRLKSGESTTFNWQVKPPEEGSKGPLTVEVSGDLKGGAKPQPFAIATLEETPVLPPAPEKKGLDLSALKNLFKSKDAPAAAPAASSPAASAPAEGVAASDAASSGGVVDKLSLPGMSQVDVPVLGRVKSGLLVIAGVGFLALVLIMAALNRAAARRRTAERRRKFRTMTEFQSEAEPEPAPYRQPAPAPEPVPVHYAPPPQTIITPPPAPAPSVRTAPTVEVAQPAVRKEDQHA